MRKGAPGSISAILTTSLLKVEIRNYKSVRGLSVGKEGAVVIATGVDFSEQFIMFYRPKVSEEGGGV